MNINFNSIINFLQEVNQRFAITSLFEEREVGHILNQQELIIVLILLVVGLLWCFAGHLMVRFWAALLGFGLGLAFGAILGSLFLMDGLILVVIGGVLGLVFGIFSARILPLGTFLVVLLSVFALTALILGADSFMVLGISLAVALVFALLSFKFPAPIVIIVTSVCGALVSAEILGILVNYNLLIYVIVAIALAVGGMCTQFLFENGKRKRQHLERANEIKDSKAEDIEKARSFADVLEEGPRAEVQLERDTETKGKKEKSKKEKPKKGKNDQFQIIFDNIEDDEELNDKPMNRDDLTSSKELQEKKSKIEELEKELKVNELKEKGELKPEKKVEEDSVRKAEEKDGKTLVTEKAEGVSDGLADAKEEHAPKVEYLQGDGVEGSLEVKNEPGLGVEPEKEEEDKGQVVEEKTTLEKPKKEKPENNYIVKNIQVEEEVERKAAELEKAKRDWINQLVSDKPKDES